MDKKFKNKSTIDPRKGKKDPLADYKAQERRKKKIKEQGSFKMGGKIMKANTGRMALDPTQPAKKKSLREKIDLERFKIEKRKKKKPGLPVGGKLKKPKPGTYDYQLQETMKPSYKGIKGMRTGGICRGMGAALRGGDFKGVK
tara:strand:+ start:193 stop:621 length:429 start_codon:yes stop_codon:yes gene_type:complete